MVIVRLLIGVMLSAGLSFGTTYGVLNLLPGPQDSKKQFLVSLVVASLCGAYGAIAFALNVYRLRFFSILGFLLDMTWSIPNTIFGLGYIPICLIAGGGLLVTDDSRRSGMLNYTSKTRKDYTMTVGTVVGGKWSRHEEVHTWQGRMFGPAYYPVYLTCYLLMLLFRVILGKVTALGDQAYRRICFEDWAYASGGSKDIEWGMWSLWLLITIAYIAVTGLAAYGFATNGLVLGFIALAVMVVYSIVRNLFKPYGDRA